MKTTTSFKRLVCLALCVMLMAVTALTMSGCDLLQKDEATTTTTTTTTEAVTTTTTQTGPTQMGKGDSVFTFKVTDLDGNITEFAVKTDELNVGTALSNLGLIDGDVGAYGLFVTKVNGVEAVSGSYWMFYINGEMAPTGVDSTEIVEGALYEFRMEKL